MVKKLNLPTYSSTHQSYYQVGLGGGFLRPNKHRLLQFSNKFSISYKKVTIKKWLRNPLASNTNVS